MIKYKEISFEQILLELFLCHYYQFKDTKINEIDLYNHRIDEQLYNIGLLCLFEQKRDYNLLISTPLSTPFSKLLI